MSGFFGAALKSDCVFDVFFGTDYHSHLGTRRAGMVFYGEDGFDRSIHNIENTPFRTKFDSDIHQMRGNLGLGCISDYEAQPLIVRSHHGTYALATVSKINNMDELTEEIIQKGGTHFLEMSGGDINATELVATLINQKDNLIEGIRYAQERIDGALTLLLLTPDGLYCARDKLGRTPVVIGRKEDGYCAVFESCSYLNLEYEDASFDVVITRNLTWTLPDVDKAYKEWHRVLKKGGVLLNYDANYANMKNLDATLIDDDKKEEPYGHQGMTYALEAENAYITKAMDIGRHQRPEYDIALLEKYGFSNCSADKAIGKKLLKEKDIKEAPMFLITAYR